MSDEYEFGSDMFGTNLDDYVESVALPKSTKAQLQIVEAVKDETKCYVRVRFHVISPTEAPVRGFSHFLNFPRPGDDADKVNNKKGMLKNFIEAFSCPWPLDPEGYASQLVGQTGWAILDVDEDQSGRDINVVRPFGFTNPPE